MVTYLRTVLAVGPKLSQAFAQLLRGNGSILAPHTSLNLSLPGDEPALAGLSPRRKFPFPARREDRFDDWVVGRQFVPDHHHHRIQGFGNLAGAKTRRGSKLVNVRPARRRRRIHTRHRARSG